MESFKIDKEDAHEVLVTGKDSICQIKYEKMVNGKLQTVNGSGFFSNFLMILFLFENVY